MSTSEALERRAGNTYSSRMSRIPLRPRAAYRTFVPITTRWHDNDAYGHVNNVIYYAFFDTAVNTWLIEQGLLDVHAGDPIGLVVETGCRYAAPVHFPQTLEVGLAVASLGTSSVTYHLGLFVQNEEYAAAEGHFTHVYVGREDRRPVALPSPWRQALSALHAHQSTARGEPARCASNATSG
ncbi:acyl-CoA thioesterase [Novosphingobium panipatense]|uniref:acyl-CoA thioesterase n=2 Tax=Novosphingobium TaxID=165696 RepID=UPI00399F112F